MNKRTFSLRLAAAGCAASFLAGTGKLALGVASLSFFTCVHAFYTYGMLAARLCLLKGLTLEPKKQYPCCQKSAIILIGTSALYGVYSVRLLLQAEASFYHPYLAIGIAAFTFAEIGLNLRGMLAERKNRQPLFHALKTIQLASALIGLVLTQTALLSFACQDPGYDLSRANGIMGILMGGIAALLGLWLLRRSRKQQDREEANDDTHSGCGR